MPDCLIKEELALEVAHDLVHIDCYLAVIALLEKQAQETIEGEEAYPGRRLAGPCPPGTAVWRRALGGKQDGALLLADEFLIL